MLVLQRPKEKCAKKHVSLAAKLFMLLLLGLSGTYIFFFNVDQRISNKRATKVFFSESRPTAVRCHHKNDHSIPVHYPQPSSYDRTECFCTPVHNFVIVSMQRCGSGWFEALLNSHPNVSSHGEVFLEETKRENFSSIKKILDTIYNLDWKSSASKNDCTSAVGFKWMLNQGLMEYNKEALAYFQKEGVSVVFLFRHNLLRRYVSILANQFDKEAKPLNGTHKSHVHSRFEAQILAAFKPEVNVTHLPLYLRRIKEISHDTIASFKSARHKIVYYEDIVKYSGKILGIQEFLGVIPRKLASHHVKIHTQPLSKQIQNWLEVYERLKGTEFEEFLGDE